MNQEDDFDKNFTEINKISDELDQQNSHIDHLFSWHDFLQQSEVELQQMSGRLSSIEAMLESWCVKNNHELDSDFGLGICWVGAVAAYEGCMHKLLLNAMAVNSLQSRIAAFCEKRIAEKLPPKRNMKTATPQDIRAWLANRTITDPRTMARNFDEIFEIKTQRPDDAFCERLMKVRNAFTHRGGEGYKLLKGDISIMIEAVNAFGISYTMSLVSEVGKFLQEKEKSGSDSMHGH